MNAKTGTPYNPILASWQLGDPPNRFPGSIGRIVRSLRNRGRHGRSALPRDPEPQSQATPAAAAQQQGAAQAPRAAQMAQALRDQLEPWEQAVAAPPAAQKTVLRRLLDDYARTGYGSSHGAASVPRRPSGRTGPGQAQPCAGGTADRRVPARLPRHDLRGLQAAHQAGDGRRHRPPALRGARRLGHHPRHHRGRVPSSSP